MGEVIHFEPPKSAHVRHLAYDPDTQTLQVTFANGATYRHFKVPPHVFATMTRQSSVGTYYHSVIRRHYPIYKPNGTKHQED